MRDRPLPIASDSAASFRTEAVRASDSRQKKLRPSDSLAVIPAASQGDQARQYLSRKRPEPVPKTEAKPGICLSHNGKSCAPEGIRTPNLLIRSQMLYPLSYGRWSAARSRSPSAEPRERTTRPCADEQAYRHTGVRGKSDRPSTPYSATPRATLRATRDMRRPRHHPGTRPGLARAPARPRTPRARPTHSQLPRTHPLVRGLTTAGHSARMPPPHRRDTVVTTVAFGLVAGTDTRLPTPAPTGRPPPIRQRAPPAFAEGKSQ